ncbi:MAG: hypothetical protein H0Z34_09370 [Brevibacillus sp.]|nr:hypothetical protein [Brevibacillus sp.]
MRKSNPKNVVKEFQEEIKQLFEFYYPLMVSSIERSSVSSKISLLNTLSEQTFFNLGVKWERFVNDIFLAYINTNSTQFNQYIREQALKIAEEQFSRYAFEYTSINLPKHLSLKKLEEYIGGFNISYKKSKDLIAKARNYLVHSDAIKFARLTEDDRNLLDALKAIRNYIAHMSRSSSDSMNRALLIVEGPQNLGLGINCKRVINVGFYLRGKTPSGKRRITVYYERIYEIAEKLK